MAQYLFKWLDRSCTSGDLSEKNALFCMLGFPFVPVASPWVRVVAFGSMRGNVSLTSFSPFVRFSMIVCWLMGLGPFCFFHVTEP